MINIVEDFFVRKSHDMITHLLQILFTNRISLCLFPLCMITSVNFDNQSIMARHKVGDIITYDVLPQEVNSQSTLS